ncbi:hypothetical protein WDU99_13535 [Microbacterium sp. Mu-80]|uniref:Apea-like HEPN domain-containing protein n=1 Tax=Microbacterium bandirmense TaxID=3122050 RepID=A0ABU8LDD3_9MICO
MKQSEAKALIRDAMRRAQSARKSSSDALADIGEENAVEAFSALERQGDGAFVGATNELKAFLWELARAHDDTHLRGYNTHPNLLPRVINALTVALGKDDLRGQALRVNLLRSRVATELGFKPDTGWPEGGETTVYDELTLLDQLELAEEQRASLELTKQLIAEHRNDVRSTIKFDLPHPLVRRYTTLALSYADARIRIVIVPTPSATNLVSFPEGTSYALSVLGGGAWPPGVSQVMIVFDGLVDWTTSVETYEDEALSSSRGQSPVIPWVAADVVRSALLALQNQAEEELDGYWMPVANDVRSYEFQVGTASHPNAYHRHYLQPGGARATVLDGPEFESALGDVERPRPWQAARVYAHGALRSARYFDSVVWANVAIEAYIDMVLNTLSTTPGLDTSGLAKATSVFADAEEIVARAHPELAGKINWPVAEKAPSRFRQIGAAAQVAKMTVPKKELQRLYASVSRSRNDAVHGRSIDSVKAVEARTALTALDDFVEKFRANEV